LLGGLDARAHARQPRDARPNGGSCWGAGFIFLGQSVDPFDPAVVRASMGALFQQAFVRASMAQLRDWAQQHHLQVVGASPDGTVAFDQLRYTHPTLLLLGEERRGLDVPHLLQKFEETRGAKVDDDALLLG